jgi:hypothetical protein
MENSSNICRADCERARALRQGCPLAVTFRPNRTGFIRGVTEGIMLKSKMFARAILVAVASIALSGCFDLTQSVSLDKNGAGSYRMAISATGFVGTAIKNGKSNVDIGDNKNVETTTVIANGITTRTSKVDFHSLSDLSLSAESIAVHVTGHGFFGLGATHAVFRRSFHVSDAKKSMDRSDGNDAAARNVIASIFGDHFYEFSVTLPGSIDWIAPARIGGGEVKPVISGDGHTITWRMPLEDLFEAQNLNFSVGFSAWGNIAEAQSRPSTKHQI